MVYPFVVRRRLGALQPAGPGIEHPNIRRRALHTIAQTDSPALLGGDSDPGIVGKSEMALRPLMGNQNIVSHLIPNKKGAFAPLCIILTSTMYHITSCQIYARKAKTGYIFYSLVTFSSL